MKLYSHRYGLCTTFQQLVIKLSSYFKTLCYNINNDYFLCDIRHLNVVTLSDRWLRRSGCRSPLAGEEFCIRCGARRTSAVLYCRLQHGGMGGATTNG